MTQIYARIAGTGSYLPPRRVSNQDMVELLAQKGLETSHEWIVERTGIHARHFADEGVFSSDMGADAARKALDAAGLDAPQIDLIVLATSTPDMVFPSTATIVQQKLGITNNCPAFDVQAVCTGFMYALTVADAMLRTGTARKCLRSAVNAIAIRKKHQTIRLFVPVTGSPRASSASTAVVVVMS